MAAGLPDWGAAAEVDRRQRVVRPILAVRAGQPAPRHEGLDAAAYVAAEARVLESASPVCKEGQGGVAPLGGAAVRAAEHAPVDDEAAAAARCPAPSVAPNTTSGGVARPLSVRVTRGGRGGAVGEPPRARSSSRRWRRAPGDRAALDRSQLTGRPLSGRGSRVPDEPRVGREEPRRPLASRSNARPPQPLEVANQLHDRREKHLVGIVLARRGHAHPCHFAPVPDPGRLLRSWFHRRRFRFA